MRKIVIATALVTSIMANAMANAMAAQANSYIDPRAPFDAQNFFNALPSGQ